MKSFAHLTVPERCSLLAKGRRAMTVNNPIEYWNKAIKQNPINQYAKEYYIALYECGPACIAAEDQQADEMLSKQYGVLTIEQMRDKSMTEFKAHLESLQSNEGIS